MKTIKAIITKWNNDITKISNDTNVLCHQYSIVGKTYVGKMYKAAIIKIIRITTSISDPLPDELLLELNETPVPFISSPVYNCFPVQGYGDSQISVPTERK